MWQFDMFDFFFNKFKNCRGLNKTNMQFNDFHVGIFKYDWCVSDSLCRIKILVKGPLS